MAKRSIISYGAELFRHIVPQVIRPIQSLWNEVIGFLFLVFAFFGAVRGFREVRHYDGSPDILFRLILIVCFVLVMGGYGIHSFLRARKISRS